MGCFEETSLTGSFLGSVAEDLKVDWDYEFSAVSGFPS
jgi:hypothetical protein